MITILIIVMIGIVVMKIVEYVELVGADYSGGSDDDD